MLPPSHPTRRSVRIGGLDFAYDERVLEPRPWTTLQSAWAAEILLDAAPGAILELCTGAGHIGLLAAGASDRDLVAVDVDPAACYFAELNAGQAGLGHRVEVRHGAMQLVLDPTERFSLVIADPPWVTTPELDRYPDDPRLAIDGGHGGLDVALTCLAVAADHLVVGGSLVIQLGDHQQADAVLAHGDETGAWIDGGRREGEGGVLLRLVRRP